MPTCEVGEGGSGRRLVVRPCPPAVGDDASGRQRERDQGGDRPGEDLRLALRELVIVYHAALALVVQRLDLVRERAHGMGRVWRRRHGSPRRQPHHGRHRDRAGDDPEQRPEDDGPVPCGGYERAQHRSAQHVDRDHVHHAVAFIACARDDRGTPGGIEATTCAASATVPTLAAKVSTEPWKAKSRLTVPGP